MIHSGIKKASCAGNSALERGKGKKGSNLVKKEEKKKQGLLHFAQEKRLCPARRPGRDKREKRRKGSFIRPQGEFGRAQKRANPYSRRLRGGRKEMNWTSRGEVVPTDHGKFPFIYY